MKVQSTYRTGIDCSNKRDHLCLRIQCDDRATISPAVIKFFTDNRFNYGIFGLRQAFGVFFLPEIEVRITQEAAA